ncbi:MAG: aminopeptidase P family protein [Caldilineaceae bacterium]|nr:aminopeptidase P family protein [Caldilineaceae bacterium]
MADRLTRLTTALSSAGYDAYIATQRPNQLYWTDSAEPVSDLPNAAFMLLSADAQVIFPGPAFYYACVEHLPNYEIAPTEVGSPSAQTQLIDQIAQRGYRRLVLDSMGSETEKNLRSHLPDVELVFDNKWGPILRRTKEPAEIEIMREAARISDLGMVAAFAAARPGVSGRAIAAASAAAMLEAGAEEASLQVAVGLATAYQGTGDWVYAPRRVIESGDMLLVDMAIRYQGYLGDQTRTAIVGQGSAAQRELIDTVQEAYRDTVAAMRPGASSPDLYRITTDLMQRKGWRKYFPHHISHGLGLGGDLPRVAEGSDDVLQVGDAFSCEPGVYIPGLGGARFENMLLLTENGIEELTKSPVDPVVGN